MSIILAKLMTYLPFIMAFAKETTGKNDFVDKIVGWVAAVGGGLIAIFIIVSLVKDGIEYAKGQGNSSIWKIIGKVLFLLLILGLIYLAQSYDTIGEKAKNIGEGAVNTIDSEINDNFLN